MTIPEYRGLMLPVLQALAETRTDMLFAPLRKNVGSRLGLTRAELAERLPSGNDTVFANRLHWALAYLERSGAVEERRGHYRTTKPAGEDALTAARAYSKRAALTSPEAMIADNARLMRERLKRDLLDRIHAAHPEFFERLIIELLLAMGYGCGRALACHLGGRGDGGIDGAVPLDVLGLDVVYIQAKRYRPWSSVPVSAVREFAGSLDARRALKGIFVTTATFPRSAAMFVSAVPSKIVLIDGQALVDLLIGYNIGVKVQETFEVKQIDEAYLAAASRVG